MESTETSFAVITTTAPNKEIALQISGMLVNDRLVACAQIFPIDSVYSWNGKIEQEKEWLIQCKTIRSNILAIEKLIQANHPYDVPELIATPIFWTSNAYGTWIVEVTQPVIS